MQCFGLIESENRIGFSKNSPNSRKCWARACQERFTTQNSLKRYTGHVITTLSRPGSFGSHTPHHLTSPSRLVHPPQHEYYLHTASPRLAVPSMTSPPPLLPQCHPTPTAISRRSCASFSALPTRARKPRSGSRSARCYASASKRDAPSRSSLARSPLPASSAPPCHVAPTTTSAAAWRCSPPPPPSPSSSTRRTKGSHGSTRLTTSRVASYGRAAYCMDTSSPCAMATAFE